MSVSLFTYLKPLVLGNINITWRAKNINTEMIQKIKYVPENILQKTPGPEPGGLSMTEIVRYKLFKTDRQIYLNYL